ncbi:hypothetical protein LUZ60_007401 [Juncus effusus]|nr:hypothetical protein LUZ60_007401 [Juncus effusus]
MAVSSSLFFSLCLVVLCNGSLAQFMFGGQASWQSPRAFRGPRGCQFNRLDALNPSQRVRSEAGVTEYYEQTSQTLQCAGVSVRRFIIEPRGLLLPKYNNAPSLFYIAQGRGLKGTIFPGCPETFQSFQQQWEQGSEQFTEESISAGQQIPRDEHQKVHRFREGDIIALPAGVTHWCYNDGDVPLVAVEVSDTSNSANQLEPRLRDFFLAGRHQSVQQSLETGQTSYEIGQQTNNNILSGFDTQLLAEAFGVNTELARRLQAQNDQRGEIVHVRQGLQLLRPTRSSQEIQQQQQQQQQWEGESVQVQRNMTNGLDEAFCTMKIRTNIDNPARADIFNQRVGRIAEVNSQKLPILNLVQMSATRVVLQNNAIIAPYWNIDFHSVMYVTGGRGRVQVVNHLGQTVFDGELRQGQIVLIPQNFAVLKRAYREGFHWVSFNTNQNAMTSKIAGKDSLIRSTPLQVLMNSYRLSTEQARRLKFSRMNEKSIFSPRVQMGFK